MQLRAMLDRFFPVVPSLSILLAACSSDLPVERTGPNPHMTNLVPICHRGVGAPVMVAVAQAALAAHLEHGDYVTRILVSRDRTTPDDEVHFRRITSALASVRNGRLARGELTSAACPISIEVAAGIYRGTVASPAPPDLEQFPIVVDVPDIALRGAMMMERDAAGRATGNAVEGIETVLTPESPLPVVAAVSTPIILANGHPGGSAGNGLRVEGFVFQSGHDPAVSGGGQGVFSMRVSGLTVVGNRFERGFTESVDLRASSGSVLVNHLSGGAGTCDMCLAGPGVYRAAGNRLLAGGIPGITTSAVVGLPVRPEVEPYVLPASAETWSVVENNEVRDHQRVPVGVGIRVEAVGTGAPGVRNTVRSVIRNNLLVNNRFGLMVHAGFPVAGTELKGDAEVTLEGNLIQGSCQAKLLVALARHQRVLGLNNNFPYLLNSTFTLSLGNLPWSEVWFGHPAGFGNTLVIDGVPMDHGSRQFYSASGCPGL